MSQEFRIFISAGEASGEQYGALLLAGLKRRLEARGPDWAPKPVFFGMGGHRMEAAGLERIVRAEDVAVMGITEVIRHLPRIYREFRRLKDALRERRPDAAVLIDFPDIHLKLARQLHSLGVPVIFFVSPQLWAWKRHRLRLVERYVDRMLVIFPFEEPFYRAHGVDAEFVGHPLADLPLPAISRAAFARRAGLEPARGWIALLPGSRAREIRHNLPTMLAAARALPAEYDFIVPLAPTLTAEERRWVGALVEQLRGGRTVRTIEDAGEGSGGPAEGGARAALFHARASVVASGTATVEAALMGSPFVVVYRVSPLTYAIARRVVTVPHVAMANLIAGRRIVPELIQDGFTAANIVEQMGPLLSGGRERESMMEELRRIRALLSTTQEAGGGSGAIDRVAAVVLECLGAGSGVAESVRS